MSENPSRPDGLSRRDLLSAAFTLPLSRSFGFQPPARPGLSNLRTSRAYAVTDGSDAAIAVTRTWTGGMLLSGDDLTTMPAPRLAMLKKLLPPTGVAAVFEDENLRVGTVTLPGRRMLCLFNWGDTAIMLSARLTRASAVTDFWSGAALGTSRVITIADMPAHSARLLECRDV